MSSDPKYTQFTVAGSTAAAAGRDAARMAKRLRTEAINAVGGPTAWSRLGYDAKVDMIRSRAWLATETGGDANAEGYILSGMAVVYATERGDL